MPEDLKQKLLSYSVPAVVIDTLSTPCLLWTRCKDDSGYGRMAWQGKSQAVHRLHWILLYGDIPTGLLVCHKCDVRHCIQPDHLFLGTHQDNSSDMVSKKRQCKGGSVGEAHPKHKLTEDQVRYIRSQQGIIANATLARKFQVSKNVIGAIMKRKIWSHI